MSTAIITGASSGLGREYALAIQRLFPEIEEYYLIARRKERLEALAAELAGKKARVLALDLTRDECLDEYRAVLEEAKPDVKIFVNNSGYGWLGDFDESDWRTQTGMVDVNVRAATAMLSITLPHMQRGSMALQVCSIAAFVPNPRMAVYSSTKAYLLSLSKAVREEQAPKGVNVLAVCPGPMDTEFLYVAKVNGRSRTFELLPRVVPSEVAYKSLVAAELGREVYTNRLFYKFYRVLGRVLPHQFLMKFSKV